MFELWHKTAAGSVFSQGFTERGERDGLLEVAADEYDEVGECADFTLHIVESGSYDGLPQPDLGAGNRR